MKSSDRDKLLPAAKRVTLDHVAQRVGVSRQTVSRVVNGKAEVKEATRARIVEAIDELGYRPNLFARGLVTQRSQAIGLVVGDITNPYFPDVARGVQDVAESHGYNVFVCNFGGPDGDEVEALSALADQGADGCIFFSAGTRPEQVLAFAATYSPLVGINTDHDHPSISIVRSDLYAGGEQVAEHLVSTGRSRLAMIGADYDLARQMRILGFTDRLGHLGHAVSDGARVFVPPTVEGGVAGVEALIERGVSFDGLFAFNDMVALGAMRTLIASGVQVPEDCAVVGCDDLSLTSVVSPTLTSIHVDRYLIGSTAMQVLVDQMRNPRNAQPPAVLPASLKIRESSQPADR